MDHKTTELKLSQSEFPGNETESNGNKMAELHLLNCASMILHNFGSKTSMPFIIDLEFIVR